MTRFLGTFPDDKLWGNNIEWTDRPEVVRGYVIVKVVGWISPLPQNGDWYKQRMESGKTAILELSGINCPGDPKDMFFARAVFKGYEE